MMTTILSLVITLKNSIKEMLVWEFKVKDLGALEYFLGKKFARSQRYFCVPKKIHSKPSKRDMNTRKQVSKTPIKLVNKKKMYKVQLIKEGTNS